MNDVGFDKPVIVPSGTFGFFGEGYRHHRFIKLFAWFLHQFAAFVAKTVTLEPRKGNMALDEQSMPRDMRPDCIFIDAKRWWRGGMLNAVGLSNFGLLHYLEKEKWQSRTDHFATSIMLMESTTEARLQEAREIVGMLQAHWFYFIVKPIIKINISCPNTQHEIAQLIAEQKDVLDIFAALQTPIYIKVSSLSDVHAIAAIAQHVACTGICVTNTWPWSDIPDWIKWKVFPDFKKSPLEQYGGGGYCGKDMIPITAAWVAKIRDCGMQKQIYAGGGIFGPRDVWTLWRAGADGISLGMPLTFRPWSVPLSIITAYILFSRKLSRRIA